MGVGSSIDAFGASVTIAYVKRCSWQYIIRKVNGIYTSYIDSIESWRLISSLTRV